MTNKVKSIEKQLKSQKHSYEFYMLANEKEKAYLLIRDELIERLNSLQIEINKTQFIKQANEEIPNYIKQMEATGHEIPKQLLSAEAFIEYKANIMSYGKTTHDGYCRILSSNK